MARANKGGQIAAAATAVNITDALSLTGNLHFSKITIKNASGAANNGYVGNSNVTNVPANAHLELSAGESYTYGGDGRGYYSTEDIYLVGTVNAANIWFIQLEE
jgi:hypothetical protein